MKLFDYLDQDLGTEEPLPAPYQGLSQAEAERRLGKNGKNSLREAKKVRPFAIFICQFKDFLTLVLLAATAVTLFLGDYMEALTIGVIVLCNGLMGFFQEFKTERTLEALRKMAAPKAKAYRDGTLCEIPAEELVTGDIIAVETGDRVPADACLLEAAAVAADESILTGESVPSPKSPGECLPGENPLHQPYLLYMGTTVTAGHGTARIIATGMNTQMGRIAGMIEEISEGPTPLQKRLDELGKYIAIGCLIICAIVAGAGLLRGESPLDMLLTGVSLAVAAVPEGLPAIVTISLALAVGRMVKQKSLIRRLHAVETLGCADVICSDKTGTLTENRMTVQELVTMDGRVTVTGSGYQRAGEFLAEDNRGVSPQAFPPAKRLLEIAVLCNNSAINASGKSRSRAASREPGEYTATGDPTEIALLVMAAKASVTRPAVEKEYHRVLEVPFDSRSKSMSVVVESPSGERLLLVKGGYDILLKRCSGVLTAGGVLPVSQQLRRQIDGENQRMAENALRVLGFAYKPLSPGKLLTEKEAAAEQGLVFAGLAGMMDPPRREAKEAVAISRKAGIKTVMITGDHKVTACAVAREIGIWHEGDQVLTGEELSGMTAEDLGRVIDRVTVFARVSPSDKLKIVRAFKSRGHITAMTGDGVNDAPAVKEADIGVAMGISGTDVTREASDVILMDDNFATLVSAVKEGRVIYRNIRKFIRYLLSCNIGEVLTMFLGILMGLPVVLLPIHILLVNLVTDGLPAIALGLEPPERNVMKRPPRRATDGIFSGGLLTTILFRGCLIGLTTLAVFIRLQQSAGLAAARSGTLLTLVFAQLIHVFECKSEEKSLFTINPFNNIKLLLAVLLSSAIVLTAVFFPPAQFIFQTTALTAKELVMIGGYLLAAPILSALLGVIFRQKGEPSRYRNAVPEAPSQVSPQAQPK